MKIIKIDLHKIKEKTIKEVVGVLKEGGIVVHPTDTCYGLAADVHNKEAVKKIYEFKKRSFDKFLSIILDGRKMFEEYGVWSSVIEEILDDKKEKMYTFVVDKTVKIPKHFNDNIDSIAIQIPRNKFSLEMLKAFKNPLTATSANISNQPSVYLIEDLIEQMKDEAIVPDLIIDAGRLPKIKPSTIVRVNEDNYKILRD